MMLMSARKWSVSARCLCRMAAVSFLAFGLARALHAAEPYTSHPPQRPLPEARRIALGEGPVYFVDAARGDDRNEGSKQRPWQSLQYAVRNLKPGDTLLARGGVYHEKVYLVRSGTEAAPIRIAAYPGELPILDGGIPEFLEDPANSWVPLDGATEGEFVSTSRFLDADRRAVPTQFLPGSWEPLWGKEEQRPLALGHFADSMVPLHGYRVVEDLRSDNELQPSSKNEGAVYCGPGLWLNRETGRIHIRLAHHQMPGLGDRAYRGETDPRKVPLVIAAGFGDDVLRIQGIRHVRFEGFVVRGATGSPAVHVYGAHDVVLDHVTVYGGFPALLVNATQNLRVTHCAFRGLAAPWSGRSHMKYRGTASYQVVFQNAQPFNENIEIAFCEFTDDHDALFLRYVKELNFHHNLVDNFNDDGLECGAKLGWHSMKIHHNRIGACLGVLQQHEIAPDESPQTHQPGSGLYIFRNVFDQRDGVYYQLPSEADPSGGFLRSEGHLLSDHGSPVYPVMRVYHNTFLRNEPVWRDYFLFGLGGRGFKHTERDVFNNLFVQADRIPGAVVLGKEAGALREGGNLLWGVSQSEPTVAAKHFSKLRASAVFLDSKRHYAAGWTTDDLVADPQLVRWQATADSSADLRLRELSPAIDAGIVLPVDWPDPVRELDRGAPDIGAVAFGQGAWGVGVDGRWSVFGGRLP